MKTGKLISLMLAGAAAATIPARMRVRRDAGYVVASYYEEPPPPPREEYVVYRPGFVWVHGNWNRDYNSRWRWHNGYYQRERPGYVYTNGRWSRNGRNWVWVNGTWRPRSEVVIRGRARF